MMKISIWPCRPSILMLTGFEFKSSAGDEDWLPVEDFLNKPVEPVLLLAEVEKPLKK